MITIVFHNTLYKITNVKTHTIAITKYSELFNYLSNCYPYLVYNINSNKDGICLVANDKLVKENDFIKDAIPSSVETIYIIPTIYGEGGSFKKIALGVALIAASYGAAAALGGGASFTEVLAQDIVGGGSGPFGINIAAALTRGLLGMGINFILSAVLESFMPKPKDEETTLDSSETRRNNDKFDGLQNTINSNQPVNLIYGSSRVSGQLISGYINSISHNKDDIILVESYV